MRSLSDGVSPSGAVKTSHKSAFRLLQIWGPCQEFALKFQVKRKHQSNNESHFWTWIPEAAELWFLAYRGETRGTIPRAPKSPTNVTKYFLQCSTFASERPQVRTWWRQTRFLPRAPYNLVTPLPAHKNASCATNKCPGKRKSFHSRSGSQLLWCLEIWQAGIFFAETFRSFVP